MDEFTSRTVNIVVANASNTSVIVAKLELIMVAKMAPAELIFNQMYKLAPFILFQFYCHYVSP